MITDHSITFVLPQLSKTQPYLLSRVHSKSPELIFDNLTEPLRVAFGQEFRV